MPGYRSYFINAEGQIVWREEFLAETEAEALAHARAQFDMRKEYPAFELWHEKRKLYRGER